MLWKIGLVLVAILALSFVVRIMTTILTIGVVLVLAYLSLRYLQRGSAPPKA